MVHKKKKKSGKKKSSDIKKLVLSFFDQNPNKQFNVKQIAYRLGLQKKKDRQSLQNLLNFLSEEGFIAEPQPWKYMALPQTENSPEGRIEITKFGYGFVSCEHLDEDIFIPPKQTANALNGDIVRVKLVKNPKGRKIEGHVIEVVERSRTEFVGVMEVSEKFAFFVPDNPRIHIDFFVPISKLNKAKAGDKVIVKLMDWPKGSKSPFAHVVKVLGKAGTHDVEMHAIIEEFGLPYEFSKGLELEADAIPEQIDQHEIDKRKDFRDVLTFTIDPYDAKDFDDAISFRKINDDLFEIGVHIADVTHYLKPGSDLNQEAVRRATSVYLVDRVIPMLPERLSNFLCSLRPHEDKLCFSAVFEMDAQAKIHKEWFGKTIINSNRRFTYEEVQEIIEKKKGDHAEEILKVNEIATKLREQRYRNGSFSFETEEVKFELNEQGQPIGIETKVRKEAHMLIEDLMLLANKKVAELLSKVDARYPSVYRIHESPNKDKLDDFIRIAKQFGYHIDAANNKTLSNSFNQLLKDIEGKPEQNFLQSLAIRSMSKAKYTTENSGHYGLAFDYYTHFTSPIRRYPDVMVHRTLYEYLNQKEPSDTAQILEGRCKHCSEREINAEGAERASIKYKQVEYMQDKIDQVFEGVISGVIESGVFVEVIENKCEGFVPINTIDDDFYILDEQNYQLQGYHHKKIYKLGQVVKIKVKEANLLKRMLDFTLVNE